MVRGACSFEEQCEAMGQLLREGKIRSWGMCNDNAFGLTVPHPHPRRAVRPHPHRGRSLTPP